jgi:hypothetical protein
LAKKELNAVRTKVKGKESLGEALHGVEGI